jgi:quercetin dioxygenase-like cupin family protein/alkylhydroperoxidase/carboxymuconolactone decarboxylase family protein YurZ
MAICFSYTLKAQNSTNMNQGLNEKQKQIVTIAAFTASGDQRNLSMALHAGLDAGLTINEIKEILVQLYAYAGFPRSLNGINNLMSVLKEREQKGIRDPLGKEPGKIKSKKSKFERGKDVQTKLTGTTATGPAQEFAPIIDTFLKEHLFADIFERDNLDYQSREIATISALSSLTGTESQLRSHLQVGRNVGLTETQLRDIATILAARVGLFPKGEKITNDNFTGTVWLDMLANTDSTFNTQIGNVTFEPKSRTRWHYHPGGQILLVTDGSGYYQEKGKPIQLLHKGDVIRCSPNIEHWHGASPDNSLTHIAIGTNTNQGNVVWLEKVTDEEYNRATNR